MFEGYIKDSCFYFKTPVCHPDVSKWGYAFQIGEGKEIPIMPVAHVLNKICENCTHLAFEELEENQCPFCQSVKLLTIAESVAKSY